VGGALVAAQALAHGGLVSAAQGLSQSAIGAFLHSLSGALRVGAIISTGGAVMAAALLPARPRVFDPGPVGAKASDRVIPLSEDAEVCAVGADA
jgi:hypothetical protein